jgi:hypothetical protein
MTQQKILSSQLSDSGVVPGTYTAADITIDAAGRVTAAASGGTGGTVTSIGVSGNNGVGVAGSPITTSGTITLSLNDITPSSVAAVGTVTGSNLSGTNTGDQTITLTGDVTGSGTGAFVTTLSDTGVSAGTYTSANVTVDAKGRITSISNGSSGSSLPLNEIGFGDGTGITSNANFTYYAGINSLYVNVPTVQNESAEVIIRSGDNLDGFGHSEILLSTSPSGAASDIYIQAGNDEGVGINGGNITIASGESINAIGGQVNLNGGNGVSGGDVSIIAGSGTTDIGGLLFLGGGNTASVTNSAGDVLIRGGNNTLDSTLSGRIVLRTDNQNRLVISQYGEWLLYGTDPGQFGQVLTSQGPNNQPFWNSLQTYEFQINNEGVGEGEISFNVQNSDVVYFPNMTLDSGNFTVRQQRINILDSADAQISFYPHEQPNFDYYIKFGTGLTVVTDGNNDEHITVTAPGGSTPGIDTQILLSDGIGGFNLAEAFYTSTIAGDAILTMGADNGGEDFSTGSIITTFQQGGGNGKNGTDLFVQAANAFFPFDSVTADGGSLFLYAGRGGEVPGVDRNGEGGAVSIIAGDSNGLGNTGGNVYLRAGISDSNNGDGNITIEVGQTGGSQGHFKVVTNETERLRIGSAGAWNLNGAGGGQYGQKLTSAGPSQPPSWSSFTWNEVIADYTIDQIDTNNGVAVNSASPVDITVPEDSTYDFPIGTSILVTADGTGTVTLVADVGVNILVRTPLTLVLSGQYSLVTLVKRAANTWYAGGDLA